MRKKQRVVGGWDGGSVSTRACGHAPRRRRRVRGELPLWYVCSPVAKGGHTPGGGTRLADSMARPPPTLAFFWLSALRQQLPTSRDALASRTTERSATVRMQVSGDRRCARGFSLCVVAARECVPLATQTLARPATRWRIKAALHVSRRPNRAPITRDRRWEERELASVSGEKASVACPGHPPLSSPASAPNRRHDRACDAPDCRSM